MNIKLFEGLFSKAKSKIDTSKLSKEQSDKFFELLKEDMAEELRKPTHIAVIGKCGVGKTSTINALFGTDWKVSHVKAATLAEEILMLEGERGALKISDLPGFGEDIDKEEEYSQLYKRVLRECDVALLILKADTRDMAEVQRMLRDVVGSDFDVSKRIIIGLNQVDNVQPGHWLDKPNLPSVEQENSIKEIVVERIKSIEKVCAIKPSQVIAYSAKRRYRLEHLFEAMVSGTAGEAWVMNAKGKVADYLELVDPEFCPPTNNRE